MANTIAINLPDIGDFDEVEVIEVLVSPGDNIASEDSIITLESDKASMEIPSPSAGKVVSVSIAVGDKVKEGDQILMLEPESAETATDKKASETPEKTVATATEAKTKPEIAKQSVATKTDKSAAMVVGVTPQADFHASPAMRKLARELGVDLSTVSGSGANGRITEKDIKSFVKRALSIETAGTSGIPSIAEVDFSKFGEVENLELSRINKISGKHLHACWLNVPHVTQFDEVNISDLEEFRQAQKQRGIKLTPLVFIIKAVAIALKNNPCFNSSLAADNASLISKKYINLGIAVDTDDGLIVPVIRSVLNKNITELMSDLLDLSSRARAGKLNSSDLQGSNFTISSLGGIGGMQFTPIVNAPEVAILGVSRARIKPIWNGSEFEPQLMLPLALSYNHRVIDGVQGVRFITELGTLLSDIRNLL